MHKIDELIPTRRTLLSRLKNWDDQESWKQFFDTYWRLIYNSAIKTGLTPAEAEDAVQETVISVQKSIKNLHYDPQKGSFKGWLLNITRWRVADQFRKRYGLPCQSGADTSTGTREIERIADPMSRLDAMWDRDWETNLLNAASERVKRKIDPKHYQVFDLLVNKKWPVAKVASFLGMNAAGVYLIKCRVSKLAKKELAYLRNKPI